LREKRMSRPKKLVATKPEIRMAITGIRTGIGPRELPPARGIRYCSPRDFVMP
jgi:hypothetical protein